jgi:tetratricopeptide (TPR) repeat protein
LLAAEEQPEPALLAATAVRTLYTLWWEAEAANPSETQQLELHRLALAGGETAIAEEVADELAGHWNRADQYRYREVIDLVTRTVAQSANARLWNQIGYAKRQLGEMQQAIDHYQAALAGCPADEQALQAMILNNIGRVYDALGDKEEALRFYNLALPLRRQTGDKGGEARTLNNIGRVYDDLGDKEEALRFYNLALPLSRQTGDKGGEATTLNNIGAVYDALGEIEKSLDYMKKAATIRQEIGAAWDEVISQWWLGVLYQKLGNGAAAVISLERGITLATRLGHPNLPQLQALRTQINPPEIDK